MSFFYVLFDELWAALDVKQAGEMSVKASERSRAAKSISQFRSS